MLYAMSPLTSIARVSVCLQGLQPCFPSYAVSPNDPCFGYVHVYVHEHVHVVWWQLSPRFLSYLFRYKYLANSSFCGRLHQMKVEAGVSNALPILLLTVSSDGDPERATLFPPSEIELDARL